MYHFSVGDYLVIMLQLATGIKTHPVSNVALEMAMDFTILRFYVPFTLRPLMLDLSEQLADLDFKHFHDKRVLTNLATELFGKRF